MMVELKNGETFNGHLVACDNFMNILMKEVFQTSPVSSYVKKTLSERIWRFISQTGDQFWKLDECYIRGNTIKYIRIADGIIDTLRAEEAEARQRTSNSSTSERGRGARGGQRGRGEWFGTWHDCHISSLSNRRARWWWWWKRSRQRWEVNAC
jgi:U6 snRNA-associated Sm-like protein LSm4